MLKEADTKPENIAERAFYKLLYGNHPYALRSSGEVDTIANIKRDDLVNFYKNHYNANVAIVAIIGDISKAEADRIARRTARSPALNSSLDPG